MTQTPLPQQHNPGTIAAPLGAYSNGVSTPGSGRWLHVAGQVGVRPDGTVPAGWVSIRPPCSSAAIPPVRIWARSP